MECNRNIVASSSMTKFTHIICYLAAILTISGCCPVLCFVPHGEAYRELAFPKPYIEKWDKVGATKEDRLHVSEECGGGSSSHAPLFPPSQLKAMRLPGESENDVYSRRFHEFERCMKRQGYKFVGECYDNEISRSSPACGAP